MCNRCHNLPLDWSRRWATGTTTTIALLVDPLASNVRRDAGRRREEGLCERASVGRHSFMGKRSFPQTVAPGQPPMEGSQKAESRIRTPCVRYTYIKHRYSWNALA